MLYPLSLTSPVNPVSAFNFLLDSSAIIFILSDNSSNLQLYFTSILLIVPLTFAVGDFVFKALNNSNVLESNLLGSTMLSKMDNRVVSGSTLSPILTKFSITSVLSTTIDFIFVDTVAMRSLICLDIPVESSYVSGSSNKATVNTSPCLYITLLGLNISGSKNKAS